jgi:hypothetical protein
VDGIVSYAPATHLYGHLFSVSLPALLGVECRHLTLTEPATAAFAGLRRPLVAALPASLGHLRRSRAALAGVRRLTLVHSTAAAPAGYRQAVAALGTPVHFVELFGSTETGLVASRSGVDATDWVLAPDVTPVDAGQPATGPVPLVVRSPRLARRPGAGRPEQWATGDLVTWTGPRTFRWQRRGVDLVKVNGRRVWTGALLAELSTVAPGVRLSTRAEHDPLRGEWFTVLVHTDDPAIVDAVRTRARLLSTGRAPRAVLAASEES